MHIFIVVIAMGSLFAFQGDSQKGSSITQDIGVEAPAMIDMIEMKVRGVTIDQRSQQPVVLLVDLKGKKALPIWIGTAEARAIAMELEGVSAPRPLTHDLIMNILAGLRAEINTVVITELKNNTFHARIFLKELRGPKGKKDRTSVDSRPSDAIALALKVKVPIYVTKKVIEAAQTINLLTELPSEKWEEKFGFHIQELTPEIAEYFQMAAGQGVLVVEVRRDSPGDKAGLRQGDIITAVGESPITSLEELTSALSTAKNSFVLTVHREGKVLTLTISP